MTNIEFNMFELLAATLAAMVVGALWYSPALFGKPWQKLVRLSDADMKKSDRVTPMIVTAILTFVEVLVLMHFMTYSAYFYPEYSDVSIGFFTALWVWVGFVVPVLTTSYVFAGRRKKLLAIDSGYQLVALLAAGIILSLWQ